VVTGRAHQDLSDCRGDVRDIRASPPARRVRFLACHSGSAHAPRRPPAACPVSRRGVPSTGNGLRFCSATPCCRANRDADPLRLVRNAVRTWTIAARRSAGRPSHPGSARHSPAGDLWPTSSFRRCRGLRMHGLSWTDPCKPLSRSAPRDGATRGSPDLVRLQPPAGGAPLATGPHRAALPVPRHPPDPLRGARSHVSCGHQRHSWQVTQRTTVPPRVRRARNQKLTQCGELGPSARRWRTSRSGIRITIGPCNTVSRCRIANPSL